MANSTRTAPLTGLVFNIQRFALDDGPGIRTTVFLKGCPLRCRWCQNPESLHPKPEIGFRRAQCLDCRACQSACPRGAIRPGESYRVDPTRCNACGACVETCPSGALFAIGQRYTVRELLAQVRRDAAFYEKSGGGVTLSGGEPVLQFEFVRAFLQAAKRAGLNTAIETNGFAKRDQYAALVPLLDRVYFDLKLIDPKEHRRLTGVDNAQILANARWLVETGARVVFRVPLVVGMTATQANLQRVGTFLNAMGVRQIEVCPYQNGWESKLSWFQTTQSSLGLSALSKEETSAAIESFSNLGIVAKTGASDQ